MSKGSVSSIQDSIEYAIKEEAESLADSNPDASAEKIKDWVQEKQYDLLDSVYPIYWKDMFALIWDASDGPLFNEMIGWGFEMGAPETVGDALQNISQMIVDYLWGEAMNDFELEIPEPEEEPEEEPAPKKKRK